MSLDSRLNRASALAVMLAVPAGCVEKEPEPKKIDPAYVQKHLLQAPPAAIQNRVDADLGGYVVYLGNDVDKEELAPGDTATLVHYWKVVSPPGSEWRVFTHLVGGGDNWMNLDQTDMRIGYPPSEWKAGDIIRDEQRFTLTPEWKSSYAQVALGLYRKGSSGPEDRMPIEKGPEDKDVRVPAFRFKVARGGSAGKRPPVPPQYLIRRASGPVAIDGKADEKDWQAATASPAFSGAEGGAEVKGAARARLLWDDTNLYAFIDVDDADVFSSYKNQDDPLWKEDVVELFIDADRNRRGYVELQVNPHNAHFDAWFPQTRAQANHPEWNSKMKSAVAVRGTLDQRGDQDQGWSAEIAIPLADVKGMDAAMKVATPPAVGDRWRLNVVRVDKPAEGAVAASSWSTIPISDFHALGRMVTVVFADAEGAAPVAKPSPMPSRTSYPARRNPSMVPDPKAGAPDKAPKSAPAKASKSAPEEPGKANAKGVPAD
jgi:Carbohydrate family 9 binding domain-like